MFKQQAQVALEPLANTMFDTLNQLMPVVGEAMEGLIPIIQGLTETIIPVIQDIMPQLIPLFQDFVPVLLETASAPIGYSVSEQRPAASVSDHCGSFAGTGAAHNRNFAADHANYIGSFAGCDRTTQHGAPYPYDAD